LSNIDTQSIFAHYIIAGLGASLGRIQAAAYTITEADRHQAWHLLSFALKLNDAWPATRTLILALLPKMEQAGYWEEWIPYLEKGIVCSQEHGELWVEAKLQMEIGYLLQRLGKLADAEHHLSSALHQFRALNEANGIALVLARLATVALYSQQMALAHQHITDAFEVPHVDHITKAFLFFTIGHIHFERNELDAARIAYENAMALWQKQNDQRRIALCLQNLGRTRMSQHEYQTALQCYEEAAYQLQEIGDSSNVAVVHMNTGITYSLLQQPETALVYYEKAEHVFKMTSATQNLAHIYTNKGIEYCNLQDWSNAEQSFQRGITHWKTIGNRLAWANALDGLGLALLTQSQHERASQAFTHALHILDSLRNLDSAFRLYNEVVEHLSLVEKAMATN